MTVSFDTQPILNSPYGPPTRHHALDEATGKPLDLPPRAGRRPSKLIVPVPRPRRRGVAAQASLGMTDAEGFSAGDQDYNRASIVDEIRAHVAEWRALPNPREWGVTPTTEKLLRHWRDPDFTGTRPFFCQIEAVETCIWLSEVARRRTTHAHIWEYLRAANAGANPDLFRIALKMATGSGKTTVMAMLIAWQTVNAVRHPRRGFSRGFLIVTPGITIKDRLRVLQTNDEDNYYRTRGLVPGDMLADIDKAKIVVTNYHAFALRKTIDISKGTQAAIEGRGPRMRTNETAGQMVDRVAKPLQGVRNIVVINDEAHHCYREKPGAAAEKLTGEEREAADKQRKAARMWISGLEAIKRKLGIATVYDLSATPFFLRGSGYTEGTLFPWTCSDFSLMDAIESGIVKLPRVPTADNMANNETLTYRNLWDHVGRDMPKAGAGKMGQGDPQQLPLVLLSALDTLYKDYEKTFEAWREAGIGAPPVFIVVCNNTSTSQQVYEWISGYERDPRGDAKPFHEAGLALFSNYGDNEERLARPRTLLIDSEQLESGEALDRGFRDIAAVEIEQFRRERTARMGAGDISDQEILREVMNTVGRKDRLGESIRCVVSVSMLTEGWDVNTVTHILGVRAFGTQLLCEQVVGRGLRRQSYELNADGLFDVEYAQIFGIPFDFAAQAVAVPPPTPKNTTHVQAITLRAALEITFPRVDGYRVDLDREDITANFTDDSRLDLTQELVGPTIVEMEGIVGEAKTLDRQERELMRGNEIAYLLSKHVMFRYFCDREQYLKSHMFLPVKAIVRRWLEEGFLTCRGGTTREMVIRYKEITDQAAERIYLACVLGTGGGGAVRAVLDGYTPSGSSRFVNFTTTKEVYATNPKKCHVNYAVLDSLWEGEFVRVAEAHPRVLAYVKNQGMMFEVPYRDGLEARRYRPDFIVRVDDGGADPLNLVVEIKGYRKGDASLKAETMRARWVPGVNALGTFGRWGFAEFKDGCDIAAEFDALVGRL